MVEYCQQDVRVNELVYKKLVVSLAGFRDESLDLEHQVQDIIAQQIKNGWLLDQRSLCIIS
jgi:hypothetical protein